VGNNGVNIGAGGYNNLIVLPTEVLIQNVPLTVAGNIVANQANGLYITANAPVGGTAQIWNFGSDGRLTFPGTPRIDTDSDNFEVQAAESISLEANAVVNIYTDSSGNAYQWQFGDDGILTFPNNLVIAGNTNVFGLDSALIQQNDGLPIVVSSSGANGAVATYWVEDVGNVGTSNIAAVYVRPTLGSNIVRIAVGQNGNAGPNLWDFDTTGNLTAPGNISAVGNITSGNLTVGSGTVNGGNFNGANFNGNVAFGTGTVGGSGNITGGNISAIGNISGGNLSLSGNITSDIGFTGATITINNAPGGVEGAEIRWALPSAANTVLNTSLIQDVYQNGMRFFEAGGNSRGLYMDLGNVPNGSGTAVGYRDIPQVSFTGNATLAATDAGRHYYSTLATANTLTIANNTSVSWTVGTAITVVNRGSGTITIAQGTGVSLYLAGNSSAGNRTIATYGMATLLNVAANVWMINGSQVT